MGGGGGNLRVGETLSTKPSRFCTQKLKIGQRVGYNHADSKKENEKNTRTEKRSSN